MSQLLEELSGCPHHGSPVGRCVLSRGGLYVPIVEHARQFCRSDRYVSCSIFLADGKMFEALGLSHDGAPAGRRQHKRFPDRISMILALMNARNEADSLLDDNAFTLDLSAGGMRLASHRALDVDSLVSFRFGREFRQALQGIGQVRWCTSPDDSPLYHAGMKFMDAGVGQAVNRYLSLAA